MATTITEASVVTSLWQRHYIFCVSEKDSRQYEDLLKCLQSSFPRQKYADLLEESAFQTLLKRYKAFVQGRSNDVTFAFWWSYLEMVENIILFIRATSREGNWSLHLHRSVLSFRGCSHMTELITRGIFPCIGLR